MSQHGPGGDWPTISVVVPVYCNAGSLPPLFEALERVEAEMAGRSLRLELIFVDDGSVDDSLAALLEHKRRRPASVVVKLTRNFGAVHASKTGCRYARGDAFMILAADLQDPPELILETASRWQAGARFVVCVRRSRHDSPAARALAWLHYRIVRWLVVRDYPRGGYDVALMGRELQPYFLESGRHVNTPLFAYWLGFKPELVYYERRRRLHGRSRWTLRKRLKFFVDSIVGLSVAPLRLLWVMGLCFALGGFGYGCDLVVDSWRDARSLDGLALLAVAGSGGLGVVVSMLGLLGEYLWRIYDEVSRKPEAVIERVY